MSRKAMSPLAAAAAPGRSGPARVALLAGLWAMGALTAHAAPAAPERLPSEVQGVVGSGDQLSLKLKDDAGGRTIKPGDDYADGWELTGLTPTKATLVKDGVTREVGLNPTGALASSAPAAPSSLVDVALSEQEQAAVQALIDSRRWNGRAMASLSVNQTARYMLMRDQIDQRRKLIKQGAAPLVALWKDDLTGPSHALQAAALGEAGAAQYEALAGVMNDALVASQRPDLAAHPITGPASYYLPPLTDTQPPASQAAAAARAKALDDNRTQAMAQAGVDPRGFWVGGPVDAQGGQVFTRVSDTHSNDQAINYVLIQSDLISASAGLSGVGAAALLPLMPPAIRVTSASR